MSLAAAAGKASRALGRALVRPSWVTTATFIAVLFVSLALPVLTPSRILYRMLDAYPGFDRLSQDTAYLFGTLERLRARPSDTSFDVAWIGGSTARESLWSSDMLAEEIKMRSGIDTEVFDMASSGQPMLVSWALAELAACSGVEFVVVAVNVSRLSSVNLTNPALYFGEVAPSVRGFLQDYPNSSKSDFASIVGFRSRLSGAVLLTALSDLRGFVLGLPPGLKEGRHLYLDLDPMGDEQLDTSLRTAARTLGRSIEWYDRLVLVRNSVEACGGRLGIYIAPVQPALRDPSQFPEYAAEQLGAEAKLESALGPSVFVLDANSAVELGRADFYDWAHLRDPEAIQRLTGALAEAFAPLALQIGSRPR